MYGQEVVLPVEINLQALRIARQDDLSAVDYSNLMMDKIDEVPEERLKALHEIEKEKLRVAKAYNKKVMEKSFQIGDLEWKMILPLGTKNITKFALAQLNLVNCIQILKPFILFSVFYSQPKIRNFRV